MATVEDSPPLSLPPPFSTSSPDSSSPTLILQGAEASVYTLLSFLESAPTTTSSASSRQDSTSPTAVLKYRPPKHYRHPTLDKRLTRQRILAEARALVKCAKEGLDVPAVLALDWDQGWIVMDFVRGRSVRDALKEWYASRSLRRTAALTGVEEGHVEDDDRREVDGQDGEVSSLVRRIGRTIGGLHAAGVVHGDLTTSNLMLRPHSESSPPEPKTTTTSAPAADPISTDLQGNIVLIDFGLATQSVHEEDRAVDLYVLERAFGSTHPWAESAFIELLDAYGASYKGAKVVLKRLEDVRLRGRKKSMIG